MRKVIKKFVYFATAAAIAAGTLSFAACGNSFHTVTEDKSGDPGSQGGFVVSTNDYYYFINGVENYTADNTYGDVVKGALMRVKKSDVAAKKNNAETVIPSLMVAADYTSGIYIYGDRIYFATPNNVKNTSGLVETDYLDFKSAKIDGSDIRHIHRVSNNASVYRFVEEGDTVYLMYVDGTELHSRNTQTGTDTVLVDNGTNYTMNRNDKSDPYVYYTMSVTKDQDSDSPITSYKYNQLYRVRADVKESPYEYTWDKEWLDENNEGKIPYINCGELVLDGIGRLDDRTQFNHDNTTASEEFGYSYTMQTYENDGIYFTRTKVSSGSTGGELYYLPESAIDGDGWNTVSGNTSDKLTVVANSVSTSKATASALYYIDEGKHHYLYVSGSNIIRVDVTEGGAAEEQEITHDATGATLVSIDDTNADYKYVYYTLSSGSGLSVNRAVYNGEAENYSNLQYGETDNAHFKAAKVLDVKHAASWYPFEILDGNLFYANAETFGEYTYHYVYTVSLLGENGTPMDNVDLEAVNDQYNELFDTTDGFFKKQETAVSANYATALKYFYYTGETTLFYENIQEALDAGKKSTLIYSNKEQEAFKAFTDKAKEDPNALIEGESFTYAEFTDSRFATMLGAKSEADEETYHDYWKESALNRYLAEAKEESEGLAWWAILLIVLAVAAVVAAAVAVPLVLMKKKNKAAQPKPEKMRVDTTDDKDVDVYHMGEPEQTKEAEPQTEESGEEENVRGEPAQAETAEPAVEAAAEPESEPAPAEPAEEPAPVEETPAPAEEPASVEEALVADEPKE